MDWKRELILFARDIGTAAAIMAIIFGILYAYSGVWPPIVVIESSSMQHGSYSQLGIIDTGDIVLVKSTPADKVVTYVEARFSHRDYKTYGDYGDVIIYNAPSGDSIIHRAILYAYYDDGWHIRGYPFTDDERMEEKIPLSDGDIAILYYPWVSNSSVQDYTRNVLIVSNTSQPVSVTISFEGDSKTYNLRPNGHITYSLKVYEKPGGKYSFKVGVGNQWKTIKFNVANSFMEWVKPQQWLLIHDVGYLKKDLLIIFGNPNGNKIPKGEGFITMGDYNLATRADYQSVGYVAVDQNSNICPKLVSPDMLVGIAQGELPWFGIIKLFFMGNTRDVPANSVYCLIIALIIIIGVPMVIDNLAIPIIKARFAKGEENEEEDEEKKEDDEDKGENTQEEVNEEPSA